ncbi:MAG: cellulase family glycosylhydrolase [Candidatus Brocadiia bacterium]
MRATALSVAVFGLLAMVGAQAPPNDTVLHLDFESPEQFTVLSGDAGGPGAGHDSSASLLVERNQADGSAVHRVELPADRLAGRLITLSADVRAENISEKPNHWNGIKVMLVLQVSDDRDYPQLPFGTGTFDWVHTTRALRIPRGIRRAHLVLGLEEVSGRAWFDNVTIRVGRPGGQGKRRNEMFKGHDLPRLRGVMYGTETSEEDLRTLAEDWGANLVRLQMNWVPMKKAEVWARDLDAYEQWLESILPEIDRGIELCEKYDLKVALDLHTPPGGRVERGVCPLFTRKDCQDKMVEIWRRLARRYRGRKVIWAYDLLNEPVEPPPGPGVVSWRELATRVTRAIREIEPGKPVIFEPGPWGGCAGFDNTVPLDLDNVIYSFHMYQPHQFTHQGVHGNPTGPRYPGRIAGDMWDKERLREAMLPAIDFQREFNVHIYVGEFSAIRWAPGDGAYNYLRDCISLFEEYGWDWSYHAYREWDGWSVEHGPDPQDHSPTETPTKRKSLLLRWFAQNKAPGG